MIKYILNFAKEHWRDSLCTKFFNLDPAFQKIITPIMVSIEHLINGFFGFFVSLNFEAVCIAHIQKKIQQFSWFFFILMNNYFVGLPIFANPSFD